MSRTVPAKDRAEGTRLHGVGLVVTLALVAAGVIAQMAAMAPDAGAGRPSSISRGGADAWRGTHRAPASHASFTPPPPHRALETGSSTRTSGRSPQAGWTVRRIDLGHADAPSVDRAVRVSGTGMSHETAAPARPDAGKRSERAGSPSGVVPAEIPMRAARPTAVSAAIVIPPSTPPGPPAPAAPVPAPSGAPVETPPDDNETGNPREADTTPEPSAQGAQLVVVGPASVAENDLVEFAIVLQNAAGIAHAPLRLSFDPDVLEFVGAAEGDLLASDGGATRFQASEAGAPGLVDIALSRVRADGGIQGSGTLCTVTFRARAAGMTSIVTTGSRLLDGSSRPLAFRRNDTHVAVE